MNGCYITAPQETRSDADKAKQAGVAGPGQLEALWQTVVEGDLFQSASHERKHLGFQLFSILLPHLRFPALPHASDPVPDTSSLGQ